MSSEDYSDGPAAGDTETVHRVSEPIPRVQRELASPSSTDTQPADYPSPPESGQVANTGAAIDSLDAHAAVSSQGEVPRIILHPAETIRQPFFIPPMSPAPAPNIVPRAGHSATPVNAEDVMPATTPASPPVPEAEGVDHSTTATPHIMPGDRFLIFLSSSESDPEPVESGLGSAPSSSRGDFRGKENPRRQSLPSKHWAQRQKGRNTRRPSLKPKPKGSGDPALDEWLAQRTQERRRWMSSWRVGPEHQRLEHHVESESHADQGERIEPRQDGEYNKHWGPAQSTEPRQQARLEQHPDPEQCPEQHTEPEYHPKLEYYSQLERHAEPEYHPEVEQYPELEEDLELEQHAEPEQVMDPEQHAESEQHPELEQYPEPEQYPGVEQHPELEVMDADQPSLESHMPRDLMTGSDEDQPQVQQVKESTEDTMTGPSDTVTEQHPPLEQAEVSSTSMPEKPNEIQHPQPPPRNDRRSGIDWAEASDDDPETGFLEWKARNLPQEPTRTQSPPQEKPGTSGNFGQPTKVVKPTNPEKEANLTVPLVKLKPTRKPDSLPLGPAPTPAPLGKKLWSQIVRGGSKLPETPEQKQDPAALPDQPKTAWPPRSSPARPALRESDFPMSLSEKSKGKRPDNSVQNKAQTPWQTKQLLLAKRKQAVTQNTFDALEGLIEHPKATSGSEGSPKNSKLANDWRAEKKSQGESSVKVTVQGPGELREVSESMSSQEKAPAEESEEPTKRDGDDTLKMDPALESKEKPSKDGEGDSSTKVPVRESDQESAKHDLGDNPVQESEGKLIKDGVGEDSASMPVQGSEEEPTKQGEGGDSTNVPVQKSEEEPTKHGEGGNPENAPVQDFDPAEQHGKGEDSDQAAPATALVKQTGKTRRGKKKNKAKKKKAAEPAPRPPTPPLPTCSSSLAVGRESPVILTPDESPRILTPDETPAIPTPAGSPMILNPAESQLTTFIITTTYEQPPIPANTPLHLPPPPPSSPPTPPPPLPPAKTETQPAEQPTPHHHPNAPPPPASRSTRLSKTNLTELVNCVHRLNELARVGRLAGLAPPSSPSPPPSLSPSPPSPSPSLSSSQVVVGEDGRGATELVWRWTGPRYMRLEQLERVLAGDGVEAEAQCKGEGNGKGGEKKGVKRGKDEAVSKKDEAREKRKGHVSLMRRVREQTEALVERFVPAGLGLTTEEWRAKVREAWFMELDERVPR
ncbi:hypothetical protein B0I37DRAFT_436482 [Chaetomium sp. MPI-CAGE-AT-0009]|nr:hypothetical protein B0I37DRAFT_436482 [Chaetomium sp. MPI-CAGE-AT-0009]